MRLRTCSTLCLIGLCFATLGAQTLDKTAASSGFQDCRASASTALRHGTVSVNNLWINVQADGRKDSTRSYGCSYPAYQSGVLYGENLIWVGKVEDGNSPLIRTGGGNYIAGVRPGGILNKGAAEDPQSNNVRVFRYRPDFESADLAPDAASMNYVPIREVTPAMVSSVKDNYQRDHSEWPWQKGAPFVDKNSNGVMDVGEQPGLQLASQVLWYSYNDLDETVCRSFAGDPSIGLEVQVTMWAYKGVPNLEDVVFKRYRLLYKGTSQTSSTARIDSMFLVHWSDPDIGNASDDMPGCDSVLGLAYAYNGSYNGSDQDYIYRSLGINTPGIGFALLEGPLVPGSSGDNGVFDFEARPGFKNVGMNSFASHVTGVGDALNMPLYGARTFYYWNLARGYQPTIRSGLDYDTSYSYVSWVDRSKRSTKFMYYGDPVAGTGWIGAQPNPKGTFIPDFAGGDPRLMMSIGPFSLALGEAQEVVIAVLASAAPTSVGNSTWLKNRTKFVQSIYPNLGDFAAGYVTDVKHRDEIPAEFSLEQNHPNPFNPTTVITYMVPTSASTSLSVFDLLGREIAILQNGLQPAGSHVVRWNGLDREGHPVPSGLYFYRLVQGTSHLTKKMLLLR